MLIIGLNAYHGDASAAAIVDGRLVAAAEEERFTRIKHNSGFPANALRYVLRASGASARDINVIAIARDPWARILHKAIYALRMPARAAGRLGVQGKFATIAAEAARALDLETAPFKVCRVEHHLSHLASSFFVSPFDQAALFSIDGLGDFASAMWGIGRGGRIEPQGAIRFPDSLGIYYTALTQYLGFPRYGDEYKVMGLASYGSPEAIDEFRRIVAGPGPGKIGFTLDRDYFLHHRSVAEMTWRADEPVIGRLYSDHLVERLGPARAPEEPIENRHRTIAASMQRRLEEVVLECLRSLQRKSGMRNLCLAGGVAFNCVTNGKILAATGFDRVYIQSAAGDAGLAIGAAMQAWHQGENRPRDFVMDHSYWGAEYTDSAIDSVLKAASTELARERCVVVKIENRTQLVSRVAQAIAAGQIVGWFQGRMEWGPRALGNRSILADPRRAEMREILNVKIKRREAFRPFAPSILERSAADYFTESYPSPFMLMAYSVRPDKRGIIPATTHVDGTGRLQTVSEQQNPLYFQLISEFERITGVPVLLNTSFNENEPVVQKPEEALACFLRTKMDLLAIGSYLVGRAA